MNAKRIYLSFLFGILFDALSLCYAQDRDSLICRNEVHFGVGYVSFFDAAITIGTVGTYNPGLEIHSQYLYNVNRTIGIGALATYERYKGINTHGTLVSISPVARFYWFNNQHFAMYSKLGAGILLGGIDEIVAIPIINVALVGMELGNRRWRGYTELFPIGTVGMLNIGVKHSF